MTRRWPTQVVHVSGRWCLGRGRSLPRCGRGKACGEHEVYIFGGRYSSQVTHTQRRVSRHRRRASAVGF